MKYKAQLSFFIISFLISILSFSFLGCTPKGQLMEKKNPAKKPTVNLVDREVISRAKYSLYVTNGGLVNCKGDGIIMETYSDQTIEMKGTANCGFAGDMDLSDMNKSLEKVDESQLKLSDFYGLIHRSPNPVKDESGIVPDGFAYFEPPRPNIINPLIDSKNLDKLKKKSPITESSIVIVGKNGGNQTDAGSIEVKLNNVLNKIPEDVTSWYNGAPLAKDGKVLDYTITASGFDGLEQKGQYMLFNTRRMWMGTNPVLIYKMELSSKLKDLVDVDKILEEQDIGNNPFLKIIFTLFGIGGNGNEVIDKFVKLITKGLPDKEVYMTFWLEEYTPISADSDD